MFAALSLVMWSGGYSPETWLRDERCSEVGNFTVPARSVNSGWLRVHLPCASGSYRGERDNRFDRRHQRFRFDQSRCHVASSPGCLQQPCLLSDNSVATLPVTSGKMMKVLSMRLTRVKAGSRETHSCPCCSHWGNTQR